MGRVLRWTTAGESHGRALVSMLEGMVAGVHVTSDRHPHPTGPAPPRLRPRRPDEVRGRRGDRARGRAPRRHARRPDRRRDRQHRVAQVGDRDGHRPGRPRRAGRWRVRPQRTTHRPRPGHADYAGMLKYGFDDARPVLERASARETAARVAAGTVAKQFLRQALGVEVLESRDLDRRVHARTTVRRRGRVTSTRSTPARCARSTSRPRSR